VGLLKAGIVKVCDRVNLLYNSAVLATMSQLELDVGLDGGNAEGEEDVEEEGEKCVICGWKWGEYDDEEILFCDKCNVAVHQSCNAAAPQSCYGVETVPDGSWFCSLCQMSEVVEHSGQLVANLIRIDQDIKHAVIMWQKDQAAAEARYGHISLWNTSAVTDMCALFYKASDFRDDISQWDVSNVRCMERLFHEASSFNCDISNWETGKVWDMGWLFCDASSFRCDVSEWDVSSVLTMHGTFVGCPVDFRAIWEEHKDDPDWKEQCRQNREFRREEIREQRRRDENWERRLPWMIAIAPYLRGEVTEAPIQMVFDIDGLIEFITSFL
jgi:hypothetical protein